MKVNILVTLTMPAWWKILMALWAIPGWQVAVDELIKQTIGQGRQDEVQVLESSYLEWLKAIAEK